MNLTHRTGMTFQILVRHDSNVLVFSDRGWLAPKKTPNWYFFLNREKRQEKSLNSFSFSSFLTFIVAKTLVASLMEVDQDQRLTAQEAIAHEW